MTVQKGQLVCVAKWTYAETEYTCDWGRNGLFWDCTRVKPSEVLPLGQSRIKNKGPHCRLSPSPTYLSRMIIYIKKKTTNTWTHDRLKSLELHNPTHLAVKKNCCCYSRNFQSEQKSENHPPRADSTRTLCHGMCMLPSERNLSTTWWSFTGELKKKKEKSPAENCERFCTKSSRNIVTTVWDKLLKELK